MRKDLQPPQTSKKANLWLKFGILAVTAGIGFGAVIGCSTPAATTTSTPPATSSSSSASEMSGPVSEAVWMTNYQTAMAQAKQENKMLLMDFTGSDWCSWCIKLDKEIFSTNEFKSYASKNLVLLKLDFPKSKRLPVDEIRQNQLLAQTYQIQGYPTIIVLNSSGAKVGTLGYMRGGPSEFIASLDKIRQGA
ncbi:MAG: thioredoxin family protein [Acidobacteria bacterium]|nr:thioredoxin family protein [Acidobacteriota bacterium]